MSINRRDFLKGAVGGGLLVASGVQPAFAREAMTLPKEAVGILYDATICVGCKACVSGCKQQNNMPPDHTSVEKLYDDPIDLSGKTLNIIKLHKEGEIYSFVKRHCMHCIDPACVSACPVSALKKNPENGVVTYNKDACIGCRYCQIACPYNVPKFEWDKPFPQIRKCQLCDHRFKDGKFSACCEVCPVGASIFGKVEDLLAEARKRLTLEPGKRYDYPVQHIKSNFTSRREVPVYQKHIYGEKEGGGTQYLMLASVPFDKLGLPMLPDKSDAVLSEKIQHGIYTGFIAPVAVFSGLLFAAYRSTKKHDDDHHK